MTEFITLGEPLVVLASENQDISLDVAEHFSKYLAGAELNVAIGLSRLGHKGIYLSKVDLENDLNEILHDKLCEYLSESNPVAYLQGAKHFRMVDLVKLLTNDDCMKIFDNYNFACLKEITK